MKPIRFALVGAGVVLGAGAVFMLGDGLLRASAFMIGLATVPIVLGVMLDSCLDHWSGIRGRIPHLPRLFDRTRFRYWERTRCSLCRRPLETSRGVRFCPDCDLAQIPI